MMMVIRAGLLLSLAAVDGFSGLIHPSTCFPTGFVKNRHAPQPSFRRERRDEIFSLNGIFRNPFLKRKQRESVEPETSTTIIRIPAIQNIEEEGDRRRKHRRKLRRRPTESASICVIGGGVSGLAAALAASNATARMEGEKIVLLEASDAFGGRVRSDVTDDGFVLDRGFAVFIEEYPLSKKLFDYESLKLGRFQPGALVKISPNDPLQRVADPLRQPEDLLTALIAPVGNLIDKVALLPLIYSAQRSTVEEIFEEEEIDTLTALKIRWGFSEEILNSFFRPFLEGIYLAPLAEQSSRMFLFVFKMFSEGYAALPKGGIGSAAKQLVSKAQEMGVDLRLNSPVAGLVRHDDGYLVQTADRKSAILAKSVIIAADGAAAQRLVAKLDGFESLESLPVQPQRSVGCLYYSFKGPAPVQEPILILSGIGGARGTAEQPINNVCFPSIVAEGYAPEGYNLCSVTILKNAMEAFDGRGDDLDRAVRKQLGTWFPEVEDDILGKWELKRIYYIENAQPGQFGGPSPANVNAGRDSDRYRGKALPAGIHVCGDHMATATLNGALESGVKAGMAVLKD